MAPDSQKLPAKGKAAEWGTERGSAARTGYAGGGAPQAEPKKPPWTAETGFGITSSMAVADGAIYLPGEYNELVSFDLETGEKRWEFEVSADREGKIKAAPAVSRDTVYVGSEDGHVYAIDANSGDKQWEYELDGAYAEVTSTPTVRDGTVYFGGENEQFHAVDADTGDEEWTMDLDDDVTASPLFHDGRIYVGDTGRTFYAIDPEYGIDDWTFETDFTGFPETAAAVDGTVYVAGETGPLYAFDAETGDVQWETDCAGGDTTPAVVDDTVYYVDGDVVRAIDADTGAERWTFETSWDSYGSPAVAEGMVYVGCYDQTLYALDAATGDEVWAYDTADIEGGPVVADGAVLFGTNDAYDSAVMALTEGAEPVGAGESTRDTEGESTSDSEESDDAGLDTESGRQETDGDWVTQQGTAPRTGYVGGGPPTGVPKKPPWTTDGPEHFTGSPAVAYGALYAPGDGNALAAYDIETGDRLWETELAADREGKIKTSPVTADGTVYVTSEDNHLYAVDAQSGSKQWEYEITDGSLAFDVASPAVRDGTVYFGWDDDQFHAVDADTGEEKWTCDVPGVQSAPVVHDGRIFVAGGDYGAMVYCLDPEYGVEEWSVELNAHEIEAAPAAADGTVYVPGDTGPLCAIDADTGDVEWEADCRDGAATPTVADGTVFYSFGDGVRAVDANTGEEAWTFETDRVVSSSPAVAEGTVFVGCDDEHVYAIDADTGDKEWAFETDDRVEADVVVGDKAVFALDRGFEDNVYALTEGADPVEADASLAGDLDARDGASEGEEEETETTTPDDEDGETDAEEKEPGGEFTETAVGQIANPEDPTDDEIQAVALGLICDEWVTGNQAVRLNSNWIEEVIAENVPGATEGLVHHNLEYLAERGCIGWRDQNRYFMVTSRPEAIHLYEEYTGERVIKEPDLMEVLEPLYEQRREHPREPALTREQLQEETYLEDDELDRIIWYLDNIGKWIKDVLLVAGSTGYVDTRAMSSGTFWHEAELNGAGKEFYDQLS